SLGNGRTRSYFAVYTVMESPVRKLRMLVHGTTLHGEQSTDPARRKEPLTYYGETSGAALTLSMAPIFYGPSARIGVLGLGAGSLACLARPGQRWTFFEIDPVVLEYSRNGTFTFLQDCTPDARVVIGDARLKLAEFPEGSFDVLVADAFSSDSIPLHLITREAVGVYLRALADDGILLMHISNRFLELEPVIAAIARSHGLSAIVRNDNPQDRAYLTPSSFVALSRNPERLRALAQAHAKAPWDPIEPAAPRVWTDNHASILPHVAWQKLLGGV
ncbi:MAG: fused MFS/spermidine synthase, partial [Novosphingobium sp.]|nr:fused MFS/spermidine synthase [Novosphingobium sp.]